MRIIPFGFMVLLMAPQIAEASVHPTKVITYEVYAKGQIKNISISVTY